MIFVICIAYIIFRGLLLLAKKDSYVELLIHRLLDESNAIHYTKHGISVDCRFLRSIARECRYIRGYVVLEA